MTLHRLALALLLAAVAAPALAEKAETEAPTADPRIAPLLKKLGYGYEIDADGDYKLVMAVGEDERTQLVFVRSTVETYGDTRIREIWSPAYAGNGSTFPGPVANRLLEASNALKMGAWVKNDGHAILVIKIDADADADTLDDAISAAVTSADEMERELAEEPGSDEF